MRYINKINHSEWCVHCNRVTRREEVINITVDWIQCSECHSISDFYDKIEECEST